MKKIILIPFILLFAIPLKSQNFSFMYDGLERSYIVKTPSSYNPEVKYPLVINMHGLGSTALEQQYYSEMDYVGDTAGFIIAYPNGVNKLWNVVLTGGVDDVGFISALIDTMAANFNIDLYRVYATGMSMGGFMSYRLACELENRIAAIASVTGLSTFSPCEPSQPVPVLQIHGTADPTVSYAGVAATIDFWTDHNICEDEPEVIDLPDTDTTDQSTVTVTHYDLCDAATEVILYTVNGGEHTWPGSNILIGITNQDIHASVEIWNFFKRFTLLGSSGTGEPAMADAGLQIHPMPVSNSSTVIIPNDFNQDWTLRVFDISGKLIREEHIGNRSSYIFNAEELLSGMYILEVASQDKVYRKKMIIN